MQKPISAILQSINRSGPLNILTISTHERYEQNLAKTGHNFFVFNNGNLKRWNQQYATIPSNYTILPDNHLPEDITFDLVLSQYRFIHHPVLSEIAKICQIPVVAIEHILLHPNSATSAMQSAKQLETKENIFISNYNARIWGFDPKAEDVTIIHHGVDTDLFCPSDVERVTPVLSVVNEIRERGWAVGEQIFFAIAQRLNGQVKLVGNNPGLSNPSRSTPELVQEYSSAKVFLNTSTFSPIPTVMLEAMACECPIVTTGTCMIPDVIQHGKNGLIYQSVDEAIEHIELLHNDMEFATFLGKNARKTIFEKFNMKTFINKWNNVFERAVS